MTTGPRAPDLSGLVVVERREIARDSVTTKVGGVPYRSREIIPRFNYRLLSLQTHISAKSLLVYIVYF